MLLCITFVLLHVKVMIHNLSRQPIAERLGRHPSWFVGLEPGAQTANDTVYSTHPEYLLHALPTLHR